MSVISIELFDHQIRLPVTPTDFLLSLAAILSHVLLELGLGQAHLASSHHFVLRLASGGCVAFLEPGVPDDISDDGSSVRLGLEEHRHEVDEAVTEKVCVRN